ncbi:hypothetical protein PCCS19_34710 [Paenibacillus sp. CCS19]|uniref:DUF5667 domain-containing protein n=1 Tax=Paenibacillus sp. CCS19 TaxID=3158387 RepID=UPI002565AFB2|nr:hypothetical protein [Paenibacillus cellulosilyticus]GMK40415.1 hypothetical protein PCCS19_34710 [Paenibacillus cellulosilyticus]
MKPTTKLNKMMLNGVLSCVLAMGIGATTAYADGNDTSDIPSATTDPVAVQNVTDDGPTLTWTADAPKGLIRAFISLAEKIQIVLTVDSAERAKLLDSLTQDKIEEANDQLEAGKTDLAANTLNNAITNQSLAILLTAIVTPPKDDEADKSDSEDKDEAKRKAAITEHIRHNIEALTHAMGNVTNPTAKAKLERNINNRLDKLSQKLDALEASNDQQTQVQVTETTSAATVKSEDNLAQTKIDAVTDKDDEGNEEADDANAEQKEALKEQKEILKAERKKQMEILKAEHMQNKMQEKADKKEAHANSKANQNQLKQDKQGGNNRDK